MRIICIFLLLLWHGVAFAAENKEADWSAELAAAAGAIRVLDLTPSGEALARRLALEINALNPDLEIEIRRQAGAGFAPDVVLSAGEALPGAEPYAAAVLYVIVNKENKLTSLTSEQIRSVYDGSLRDWSSLTGSPFSIHRYAVAASDIGNELMTLRIMDGKEFAPLYRASGARELQLLVGTNVHAIGFMAESPDPKIPNLKTVAVNGVPPSAASIGERTYTPVLFRFVRTPGGQAPARAFAGLLREYARRAAAPAAAK